METTEHELLCAVQWIQKGGVVLYPTEAVYALGCDPFNEEAVKRILLIKKRSIQKGLILIASDWSLLEPFTLPVSDVIKKRAFDVWPGPYTWLFPKSKNSPAWIDGGHNQIAVRVTAHPLAKALSAACHLPLVSTSANWSGSEAIKDCAGAEHIFGSQVDYCLRGSVGASARPTPIRDVCTQAIIRS